ncbi:MAG: hypothetical protein ACE144_18100 [Thermodesulfobacteriota bacterium]
MRRPFLILILVITFFLLPSFSYGQVQTRLKVFEASNVGGGTDSFSKDMRDQFKSLFSFSSYRLLKEETLTLFSNQPASVSVPPGKTLELTLTGQQRNVAEVIVKVKEERTDVLNTKVRLSPGRTVSIGGPKYGQGVLIITLAAQF